MQCRSRTYVMVSLNIGGIVRDGIGDAEIDELKLSLDHDEICRFQIRVDDFLIVNDLYSLKHLKGDEKSVPRPRERSAVLTCCQ